MTIPVNPPPHIQWPQSLLEDPALAQSMRNLDRFLLQLWTRTGASVDLVDDSGQNNTANSSRTSRNAAKINALEQLNFRVEIVDSDQDAEPFTVYVCTNATEITITLDDQAIEGDIIHIKRSNGPVRVNGAIDGEVTKLINIQYWSMQLIFNGTDWSLI